uniref:VPS37 C-terminal domain-containing protein n=1 Tax=Anopheles atroparvus TaxID=41427 RepID=A0AAG5CW33_ANOAO
MYQSLLQQSINSLQTLSSDELRDLLGDDEKLDERVDEVIKSLESSKDVTIGENRRMAEANLAFEPKMIELRSRVLELTTEGQRIGEVVKEKADELKSKADSSNSETVLALLQTAAAESEEESERIVKQFLDSELSTEAYLEQFMGIRKLMHTRKLKAEKMAELLRNQTLDSSSAAGFGLLSLGPYAPPITPAGFYRPPASFGPPGAVPYPTGQNPMPMPMPMYQPPHF